MYSQSHIPSLPSFSIIIETENLASAEIAGLVCCLDSLVAQDVSVLGANEVLTIDSGNVPVETIEQLCQDYPFLKVRHLATNLDYYGAKIAGAASTTGDIIVFVDSDCIYAPDWLGEILEPFARSPQMAIVAGETQTPITNAYELAIALTYIFPRLSNSIGLTPTSSYFCNNVAFRRELLQTLPIPLNLPIYRGNCTIHSKSLLAEGQTIWRQPQARATHAVPNGLGHFCRRFLQLGADALTISRLDRHRSSRQLGADLRACLGIGGWKLKQFVQRCAGILSADLRYLLYLPLALPIAILALLLFVLGLLQSCLRPQELTLSQVNPVNCEH
jgi:glycosyltransferase involved in cell wall biosynthesis